MAPLRPIAVNAQDAAAVATARCVTFAAAVTEQAARPAVEAALVARPAAVTEAEHEFATALRRVAPATAAVAAEHTTKVAEPLTRVPLVVTTERENSELAARRVAAPVGVSVARSDKGAKPRKVLDPDAAVDDRAAIEQDVASLSDPAAITDVRPESVITPPVLPEAVTEAAHVTAAVDLRVALADTEQVALAVGVAVPRLVLTPAAVVVALPADAKAALRSTLAVAVTLAADDIACADPWASEAVAAKSALVSSEASAERPTWAEVVTDADALGEESAWRVARPTAATVARPAMAAIPLFVVRLCAETSEPQRIAAVERSTVAAVAESTPEHDTMTEPFRAALLATAKEAPQEIAAVALQVLRAVAESEALAPQVPTAL